MELQYKIIGILKQEFPELKLPEIQEGFPVTIHVSIDRPGVNAGDQVRSMEFNYCSASGSFTYAPMMFGMSSVMLAGTSIEDFQEKLHRAKENGPANVKASVTYLCNAITV